METRHPVASLGELLVPMARLATRPVLRQRLGPDTDRPLMHLLTITLILVMEKTGVAAIVGFEQHQTIILSWPTQTILPIVLLGIMSTSLAVATMSSGQTVNGLLLAEFLTPAPIF